MKNLQTFDQFVNESVEPLNESFSTSDTAEKIFKDIESKYDYVQLNADTYEKIKKALSSTGGDMLHSFDAIVKSRNFNKKLQKEWLSGIHKNIRFYFAGDKIVSILNRQPGRKDYTVWEYDNGEWFRGWGGSDKENHFIISYPKLFKEHVYHIYEHSDNERGMGYAGTLGYFKGRTEQQAMAAGKAANPEITNFAGITVLDKKEVQEHLKKANQKSAHWTAIAKQISKL